jgi:hypothetical protein
LFNKIGSVNLFMPFYAYWIMIYNSSYNRACWELIIADSISVKIMFMKML